MSSASVQCDGVAVSFNALYFDEWSKEGTEMALTVNCPHQIDVANAWGVDFQFAALYGMKGRISRANQCKAALDGHVDSTFLSSTSLSRRDKQRCFPFNLIQLELPRCGAKETDTFVF